MQNYIKNVLRWLIGEYVATWAIAILAFIAGEQSWLPLDSIYVGKGSQTEYYLNIVCIVLTAISIVFSLQLFTLNTSKGLKRMNHDEALHSYHMWSCVRLGMLLLATLLGIVLYFIMMNTTGILCACMAMVTTLTCIPSEEKLNKYIENLDSNTGVDMKDDE